MDVLTMIKTLRAERDQVEEAIIVLERIARGAGKRRGRPPAWMNEVRKPVVGAKRRGRPPGSKNRVAELKTA